LGNRCDNPRHESVQLYAVPGQDWEQQKIREIMEKESNKKATTNNLSIMRKYSKYNFEEEELLRNNPDPNYVSAYRRMKRIKAFYVHLFICLGQCAVDCRKLDRKFQ
jgi:pimeloyl-CoA synthetase